jgi:uncharacterized protein YhbP (UPF0306 family)
MGCHTWYYKRTKSKIVPFSKKYHWKCLDEKVGNKLYIENEDYHDGIRVSGYPNDKLFNYTDFLKFITKNVRKLGYRGQSKRVTIQQKVAMKRYFQKFPDSLITFG